MESAVFNNVVEEQLSRSMEMLVNKNAQYNPDADKLRAFKTAATLQNVTPQVALAGMMAKHTTSIYDMCHSERTFAPEVWDEKITDSINYLLLLQAVVTESRAGAPEVNYDASA